VRQHLRCCQTYIMTVISVVSQGHQSCTQTKCQYKHCKKKKIRSPSLNHFYCCAYSTANCCRQRNVNISLYTYKPKQMMTYCTLLFLIIMNTSKSESELLWMERYLRQARWQTRLIYILCVFDYTHAEAAAFHTPRLNDSETIREEANWLTDS